MNAIRKCCAILCSSLLPSVLAWAQPVADTTPPSTPYALSVTVLSFTQIRVSWTGSGDDEREGQATAYQLRMSAEAIETEEQWAAARELSFRVSSRPLDKEVVVTVDGLVLGAMGHLAVKAVDDAGNLSAPSETVSFKIVNPFERVMDSITELENEGLEVGRESDGRKLLGCLAWFEGNLYPGKYGRHLGGCAIAHAGREENARLYRFISASSAGSWAEGQSQVPDGALALGYRGDQELFLCRGTYNGGLHAGHALRGEAFCRIPWGGEERRVTPFAVRVD